RTEDGEDVTLLEPTAPQRAGDPVHAVGQGAVGQLPAADAIDESRPVANSRRPLQYKPRQRNIRDLERRTLMDHLVSIWSLKDLDQAFVAPPKLHKMSADGSRALPGSGWSRTRVEPPGGRVAGCPPWRRPGGRHRRRGRSREDPAGHGAAGAS